MKLNNMHPQMWGLILDYFIIEKLNCHLLLSQNVVRYIILGSMKAFIILLYENSFMLLLFVLLVTGSCSVTEL